MRDRRGAAGAHFAGPRHTKDGVARKQERRPASANTYNRNGVMSMEQAMKLWLEQFTAAVRQTFGARVEAIGIQGSHGRGEAAEQSDIDRRCYS
ncbi:nucleotidyltransferase domain-containing protein [Anaerotruncus colihominis]|uniref:nucleotidyltransferase domain-containing protein n=2 Tax=Anaerotruncus colihominis TaxID=169435 RepID=UPI00194FE266|nr:nucleotidyltransferase domain-containing protein [Anaerotruncus colihominis]